MPNRKREILVLATLLALAGSACNMFLQQREPGSTPTQIVEPAFTPSRGDLPQTEAEVPRVTVEEAKVALDSGEAIVVDVRSAEAYEVSHIVGAIHIPLGEIEANPTGFDLDTDRWIITYCT
ncbi:MAG TPA: rhodanese-like domain-containing protein [Anaerolineales bacterium]|nr:rhodanese-like domain-containing protein [Anaerolineales bacterium]